MKTKLTLTALVLSCCTGKVINKEYKQGFDYVCFKPDVELNTPMHQQICHQNPEYLIIVDREGTQYVKNVDKKTFNKTKIGDYIK